MTTVAGPGRCTECSFHVATQGHRHRCSGTAPVTPESTRPDGWDDYLDGIFANKYKKPPKQRRSQSAPAAVPGANRAYVAKGLRSELQKLCDAPNGERNFTLAAVACRVFEFVKAGHVDEEAAWDELERIALNIGLTPSEIKSTLNHQWNKVGPAHIPAPGAPAAHVVEVAAEDLK